jgi:uncharacterized protein DUF1653
VLICEACLTKDYLNDPDEYLPRGWAVCHICRHSTHCAEIPACNLVARAAIDAGAIPPHVCSGEGICESCGRTMPNVSFAAKPPPETRKRAPKPGDVFTHYKGGKYRIVCVGQLESDQTLMVVYASLERGERAWIRPLAEFLEEITVPRFKKED